MLGFYRLKQAGLSSAAALVLGAAAPPNQLAQIPKHHASHTPLPSTLPPPQLIGDPATNLTRTYGGKLRDVLTYHYDANRTGWNDTETDLTPESVASTQFGLLTTLQVDGNVLAQPLLVSGLVYPNGDKQEVLVIATGHDSVYGFDARNYKLLWHVSLGTAQSSTDVGCADVQPEYGITSTPVIVRASASSAILYVVAATEPSPNEFVSTLHALDVHNGKDLSKPRIISPSAKMSDGSTVAFDPQNEWNRPGLAYANGSVYVGIGSHCDNNPSNITGWLLRYSPDLAPLAAFHTVHTHGGTELASIWMTGFAPAIDSKGNVFFSTGNGDFTEHSMDWGESVLKLGPKLHGVNSWFTAYDYSTFNTNDTDLGSGGVMLIPPVSGQTAPPLAVTIGKSSQLYLLNQDSLGGLEAKDAGVLQVQPNGGNGVWGGPAFYNGPEGPTVFTQAGNDVLRAWSVATGTKPALTHTASGTSSAGYGGSLPIVSSNAAKAATGIVWLINRAQEPFSIEAYNATSLGHPIFSAQVGTWSNTSEGNPFLTPMEVNGRVYAPGYKLVQVYGLTP
jgi:hypothetical protein